MPDGTAPCPIWLTRVPYEDTGGDATIYDSPRAGGRYWITGRAFTVLEDCDDAFRDLLTSWLVDKRKAGEDCPKVYTRDLDSIAGRSKLSMEARALNLLVYISRELPDQAELFEYETQVESEDYYDDQRRPLIVCHWHLLAWSESRESEHVCNLLDYLVDTGCLERVRGGATLLRYRITAIGWAALEPSSEPPSPPTRKIGFR